MTNVTSPERQALFQTTHWSLVVSAAAEADSSLEALCQQYWQPVYAVARGAGHDVETAKDLTQGFFAKLLQNDWLQVADREKGRFRTFLVTALKRYMVDEWRKENTVKRGGEHEILVIDEVLAEQLEISGLSPDQIFDRHWALALLDSALARLERESEADFALLKNCLTAQRGEIDYAKLALKMGNSEGAARVAVHRMRKRYRTVIREEVARTVVEDDEVQEEMSILLDALSGE